MTTINPREEHREQTRTRLALRDKGYLRPLSLCEKRPWLPGWNTEPITEATIKALPAYAFDNITKPALTTGIQPKTAGHHIVFIDSDVGDPDTSPEVEELAAKVFGEKEFLSMPYRHSGMATFALLCRTTADLPYAATDAFLDGDGEVQRVEMFGEAASKQMGCFGPHTITTADGKPVFTKGMLSVERTYEWGNISPLEVAPEDLPLVSPEDLTEFLRECSRMMSAQVGYEKVARPENWVDGVTKLRILTDDTMFDVRDRGRMTYAELRDIAAQHGDQRCSMSFIDPAHDNLNKGIASTFTSLNETYLRVYDFETEITYHPVDLSPTHLSSMRAGLNKRKGANNG